MHGMFKGCPAFNSNLSTWNTSNCTNMRRMFESAISFDSDLSQWNMSKVEDKVNMFLNATAMKASHKPKGVD
jgi:MoxR-like ATPase